MSHKKYLARAIAVAGPSLPFYAVLVVAIVTLFAAQFVELLDQDEMIYALVARDLLDGLLPYQGSFDHKPVAVYYIYAATFTIFGESFVAIRIMAALLLLGTCWNVYRALVNLSFSREAIMAAVVTCLAVPMGLDGMAGNTEVMLTFCLSLLFLLATKVYAGHSGRFRYLVLFGAVVAVGFSINYLFSFIALFSFFALLLSLFLLNRPITSLLICCVLTLCGFVLGMLIIFSPYIYDFLNGGTLLKEYIYDQSIFHQGYGGGRLAYAFLMEKVFVWFVPFVPIIVGAAFSVLGLSGEKRLVAYFSIASFFAAVIASSISTMFFNHYWIMSTVAFALFAAMAVTGSQNKDYSSLIRYTHALILICYIASGWGRIISHHFNIGAARELHNASAFIQETIPENAKVAGLSVSPVHVFINKLNVYQKYQFDDHVYMLHDHGKLDGDEYFMGELAKDPDFTLVSPLLCVPPRGDVFIRTCAKVEQGYEFLASFEGARPIFIYKRITDN